VYLRLWILSPLSRLYVRKSITQLRMGKVRLPSYGACRPADVFITSFYCVHRQFYGSALAQPRLSDESEIIESSARVRTRLGSTKGLQPDLTRCHRQTRLALKPWHNMGLAARFLDRTWSRN
jgi:hypothetical protein